MLGRGAGQKNQEFFTDNPDIPKDMIPDENSDPLVWVDENDEQHMVITTLPRKKGVVDDTFVFLKG